ncbi:MAG: PAS domain-containing protein [Gaiellaceae bacterium]
MRRIVLPVLAGGSLAAGALAFLFSGATAAWLANGAWTGSGLFAVCALVVACGRIPDRERRRPWVYLLAACVGWLGGQLVWDVLMALGVAVPFPSLSDVGWIAFAPLAVAGVYRLAPASPGEKAISALDTLATATAVGAVVAVLHHDRTVTSELPTFEIALALAYAVLYSAAAATIAQSLCTRLSLLRRPDLLLLMTGLLAQGVAFCLWAGALLDGSYVPGAAPYDLLQTAGFIAIGLGGLRAIGEAAVERTAERDIRLRGLLPVSAILGLTILVIVFAVTGAPLRQRLVLQGALLGLMIVFALRNSFVSAEHARLVASERSAAERAERFFRLAPQLFSVAGPDGFTKRVNPRFVEVLGWSEDELLARPFLELVHPDDREATLAELARISDGGLTLAFENRIARKDGEYVWLLWNSREDPESGLLYGAAQEITERKRAEAALRESEQRFAELVTTIPEVFFIAHADLGGTIYVSPAYETIWGRSCQSLVDDPQSWLEAIHEDDRARVLEGLEHVNREGRVEHEFRIIRPDGEIRLIHELVTVILDEQGRPTRHVGLGSDVTEQRELEQQLQHARKLDAVGELAGGIAHDFNNILTGIAGFTELALARPDGLDEELRGDLEEILGGARRAGVLTRQLLTFARREVARPQVVALNEVIEGVSGLLRGTIPENVRVITDLAGELGRVKVDPHQLEQVLLNLVLNAGDAMPEGGVLTVRTFAPSGAEVALAVADTGTGMTEEVRARMFEPFFTTKDVGKGTGLGLAAVYGIVEECCGRILVESEPGGGSTFVVTLPVTQEAPERRKHPDDSAARAGSERILLVEDDELVRRLTCALLEREGYRVIVAATPLEALGYEGEWDLLLTDVVMPELNGPELATRLGAERPPFQVLFTSGYSGETMVERGALDPGAPLLQKPFSRAQLAGMVRDVLDAPPSGYGREQERAWLVSRSTAA